MSWTVDSVMTRRVVTARPTTRYKELVRLLAEHDISALPIVDVVGDEGRLVGVVSQADLLVKEEDAHPSRQVPALHDHRGAGRMAADLMRMPAVTVRGDDTVARAARLMHRHHVKRLPVVDGEGRLVGIVSRGDLLEVFLRSDESIAAEVRDHVLPEAGAAPGTVRVTVADGVVALDGELPAAEQASRVVMGVHGVEGVVGIDDRLTHGSGVAMPLD